MIHQTNTISQLQTHKSLDFQVFFIKKILRQLSPGAIRTLNAIFAGTNCFDEYYAGQERIGRNVGLSRETVNRLIQLLKEYGFIEVIRRPYKSNLYFTHSIFNNPLLRERLKHTFKTFFYLPICILKSFFRTEDSEPAPNQGDCQNVTLLNSIHSSIYLNTGTGITGTGIRTLKSLYTKREPSKKQPVPVAKREKPVNEIKTTQLIPDYIEKIPLPLTMNGKITFSVFPKAVLEYAFKGLYRFQKPEPEERARYLYAICKRYSAEQKINIRYDWAFKLKEKCDIPKNSPFTDPSLVVDNTPNATMSQPGTSSLESNTINRKDDATLHKDMVAFIAKENREMVRKLGLDINRYDEMRKEYRAKKEGYSNTYHNSNVSDDNAEQTRNTPQEKDEFFAQFSASRNEDPVIAYAKVFAWEQSENFKAVNAKLNLPPSPFKRPEDISDKEGYYTVEAWKYSKKGQDWINYEVKEGRITQFVNPYRLI